MGRPFNELHELYRIVFNRAEEQRKADEERAKKEAEEAERQRKANAPRGIPARPVPTDVNESQPTPSPFEMEALEDALEEMM